VAQAIEREIARRAVVLGQPVELMGRVTFPRIGTLPYLLPLAPYGYLWFSLVEM